MEAMGKVRVAVLGAGAAGLRVAERLSCSDAVHVTLFDAGNSVGGVLQSERSAGGDFLIEHAAQGVLASREAFLRAVRDTGMTGELIAPPQGAGRRYLWQDDTLVPLSPFLLLRGYPGFLGLKDLFRLWSELFRKALFPPLPEESVHALIARRFGPAVATALASPAATGIWAGGARRLLAREAFPFLPIWEAEHHSLLKAMFRTARAARKKPASPDLPGSGLLSFTGGMQALMQALSRKAQASGRVSFRLGTRIKSLALPAREGDPFAVDGEPFDSVIWCLPPWKSQVTLSSPAFPESLATDFARLRNIPTHSVAVVALGGAWNGFKAPAGFGALAAESAETILPGNPGSDGLLGAQFVHSLFPDHVPRESFLYRVLLGGERDPALVDTASDEMLIQNALRRLIRARLIAPEYTQKDLRVARVIRWPQAIPLPTIHQDAVRAACWRLQALNPGLYFAGNWVAGVSVADTLASGEKAAEMLLCALQDRLARG